jgi:hypothetical protein
MGSKVEQGIIEALDESIFICNLSIDAWTCLGQVPQVLGLAVGLSYDHEHLADKKPRFKQSPHLVVFNANRRAS